MVCIYFASASDLGAPRSSESPEASARRSGVTALASSARKPWLLPWVRRYVDHRLRGAFEAVFVSGLDDARALLEREPAILAANHVAWWDPFVITTLDARLHGSGHALMDAESLRRLWFFGAIGAVPLRRDSGRHALADLGAAAQLLRGPRSALWIFPQGRQRPSHLRPLDVASGVAWLAERSGAATLPVSLSYLYREAAQPAVFAAFGPPVRFASRSDHLAALESRLIEGLDQNDVAATRSLAGYQALWPVPRRDAIPLAGRLLTRSSDQDRRD